MSLENNNEKKKKKKKIFNKNIDLKNNEKVKLKYHT